ncbi:thioredoxin family protein [Sanyastnella coralliicola]|uniref:thioredoxin family protein n=1 Tax=Sanyastnella coralliicola TaxID=3069118 RepID=UPI0027BA4237|nr:thioredoxin family protein [Longitalea sp. SCSIO 12813]
MRQLLSLAFLALCAIGVSAQQWQTDFDSASALAKKEGKKLIMVFQGSDWCAPCMKLDHEIISQEQFVTIANAEFVLLQVDFPRRKKNALSAEQTAQNKRLASMYNPNGIFPLVVVFDSNGKKLGELGYEKTTPDQYANKITQL